VTKEEKEKENTRKVMPIANMVTAMPPAGRPSSVQARPICGILQDDTKTVRRRPPLDISPFFIRFYQFYRNLCDIFLCDAFIELYVRWLYYREIERRRCGFFLDEKSERVSVLALLSLSHTAYPSSDGLMYDDVSPYAVSPDADARIHVHE